MTVTGYDAGHGFYLVTGVGTIDAARFVPALVATWRSLNPLSQAARAATISRVAVERLSV